jgi:hypothetical protein
MCHDTYSSYLWFNPKSIGGSTGMISTIGFLTGDLVNVCSKQQIKSPVQTDCICHAKIRDLKEHPTKSPCA